MANLFLRLLAWIRSFFAVIFLFPVWTVGLSALNILHNLVWGNRAVNDAMIGLFTRGACWMFGVKVQMVGGENIPAGSFLLLFNHTSFFDIFAIQGSLPRLRFGAKIELFSIPVFGQAMRAIGVLPIARGNVEEVIRVYRQAESRTQAGEAFALAPEGGRNVSGEKLMRFKAGPFLFAINAQIPILPCVVEGAREVWPKGHLIPQTHHLSSIVKLTFLPPLKTQGFDLKNKEILQKQVYSQMLAVLDGEARSNPKPR